MDTFVFRARLDSRHVHLQNTQLPRRWRNSNSGKWKSGIGMRRRRRTRMVYTQRERGKFVNFVLKETFYASSTIRKRTTASLPFVQSSKAMMDINSVRCSVSRTHHIWIPATITVLKKELFTKTKIMDA